MDFLCKIRKQLDNISNQDDMQRYCTKTYAKINEFRLENKLCDVILKVSNYEFPAHKIVLAASSDFFSAMFSCGMSESEQSVIELKSISLDIINEILEYIYTGNVTITNDNVQELLPAANLTQLLGLKRSCCIFLMRQIDAVNVLGIRRFAEIHDCPLLEKFARKYAAHNMETILQYSDEFVQLSRTELRQLIKMPDLNVYSEESVYKAIIKWVYYSIEVRRKWLSHLLRKVRLSQLSIRFLTDIVSNETLIHDSLICRDLIDEAKLYHLRPDVRANLMRRANHERFWPRSQASVYSNHFLVLVGGFGSDQAPISSVEMFDPRSQKWGALPSLPGRYRYVAACSLASCIYVIGGFDGRERLNTVSVLDVGNQSQGWIELAPMNFKRGLAATCVYNGKIFVCGGFDGIARLKSLEVYNPIKNGWIRKSSMDTSREGAGLVVVDGFLYCIGGYNGMQLLDTVEKYDISNDIWCRSESMHYRRSGAGCAVMNETIYVCGGYGGVQRQGPQHLDSVECYNTLTQQWSFITSMQEPRCYIGACQMDNMIWVAAGYDGNRLLNTVEAYDRYGLHSNSPNTWNTLKSCPMRNERCDTGMCIVQLYQLAEPAVSSSSLSSSSSLQNHQTHISDDELTTIISGDSTLVTNRPINTTVGILNTQSSLPGTLTTTESEYATLAHTASMVNSSSSGLLYPAAPFNSQSGQPVPSQHGGTNLLDMATATYSMFDDGAGSDELEGRGGPQLTLGASASNNMASPINMEVPGSVQMMNAHHQLNSHHHLNLMSSNSNLRRLDNNYQSSVFNSLDPSSSTSITNALVNPSTALPLSSTSNESTNRLAWLSSASLSVATTNQDLLSNRANSTPQTTRMIMLLDPISVNQHHTDMGPSITSGNLDNQDAFCYLDRILSTDRQNSVNSLSSDETTVDKDEDNGRHHLLNVSMPFLTMVSDRENNHLNSHFHRTSMERDITGQFNDDEDEEEEENIVVEEIGEDEDEETIDSKPNTEMDKTSL